ncbi:MAG: pilus assembly PilX N-terminal domain-containing protein [Patescibacteria group bacterium]
MTNKKRKGSAIIVAVLLSAIVGGAAIGIAAVSTRQIKISETYNKGLLAFYAAESGLEEGLLYYKHNPSQEIPEIIDITDTTGGAERLPKNVYRNFLKNDDMRPVNNNHGILAGYTSNLRQQVYDLQVFYKQKYYGDDRADPRGIIDSADIAGTTDNKYRLQKDEASTFDILPENNNIYLYWRWTKACNVSPGDTNPHPRALEIKIKTKEVSPISNKNEYTKVYKDPRCAGTISNSTNAIASSDPAVFSPGTELKSNMGISALTAVELIIKPVGNTAASDDSIYFGFNQIATGAAQPSIRTTGPTTTVKSVGYYNGTTRQITANINRQNGTIADIFQYVLYQGQ